jgi:SAM-dependent methyltransferase
MALETSSNGHSLVLHGRFWASLTSGLKPGPETRVLEVGCGRGESLVLLRARNLDAYGFDLGAATGPLLLPKSQYAFGSLSSAMTFPQHHFDLVVVRPTPAFRGELAIAEHYVATANLLSCVKPGGRLVIVEPSHGRDGTPASEWLERWQKHLAAFTTSLKTTGYRDGLGWWLSFAWLSRAQRLDLKTIVLTTPAAPVSRLEWHRQARAAVMPKARNTRNRAA